MNPTSTRIPGPASPNPSARVEDQDDTRNSFGSLQGWPSLAGVAFAGFVAIDLFRGIESGADLASIVAASALVYLAAATAQKRVVSWIAFLVTVVVITVSKLGVVGVDATWILLGAAALCAVYGAVRASGQSIREMRRQSIAMLVFGLAAAIALNVAETFGAYLVAAGLLAHAAWDVHYHRANKVVSRSLAEFCFVLDALLALAIVVATVRVE